MATFYTSYNQEYAPSVRASITYTTAQDVIANTTTFKFSAVAQFGGSGNYYRSGAKVVITVDDKTITSTTKSIGIGSYSRYGTDFNFATDTITVKHNEDGTKKGVVVSATLDIQGTKNNGSVTIDLDTIPRGHKFSLDKTMLTAGKEVMISALKSVNSYTSNIEWTNGVQSGTIASDSDANSWIVTYETLSNGLASGVTRTCEITCITMNGDTEIARTTLKLVINTGNITLSLYDDGDETGVTFGERATKSGVNFRKDYVVDFTDAVVIGLDNVVTKIPVATNYILGGVKSGNDIVVDENGLVTVASVSGRKFLSNTTANWNAQPQFVPSAGSIIIYNDYKTTSDGKVVAGIKIGDGDAFLVDLPFVTDAIAEQLVNHINNTTVHITAEERASWNKKVTVSANGTNLKFDY